MTKTGIAKMAIGFVVGTGTKIIIKAIVRNNVDISKVADKVAVEAATWVLSALVAKGAKQYTDKMINDLISQWQEIKSKIDEARNEM